ncbi:MAG: ATP-binding protein [Bacteroidota bacterium]|nr:ATP-binding protein [Bacteroidota bacterium]
MPERSHSRLVHCILRDSFGYTWFATEYGLIKYDGVHFIFLQSSLIQSSICFQMVEDEDKILWIGTSNGLLRYDLKTDSVSLHSEPLNSQGVCSTDFITRLYNNGDEIIFLGLLSGMGRFNKKTRKFSLVTTTKNNKEVGWINHWSMVSFVKSPEDIFYISSQTDGLFKIEKGKNRYEPFPLIDPETKDTVKQLRDLCLVDNYLWIGTEKRGIYLMDINTQEIKHILLNKTKKDRNQSQVTWMQYIHRNDGEIWITTEEGAYSISIDYKTKNVNNRKIDLEKLSNEKIYYLYPIDSNNYWIGYEKGVIYASFEPPVINFHPKFRRINKKSYYIPFKGPNSKYGVIFSDSIFFYNSNDEIYFKTNIEIKRTNEVINSVSWVRDSIVWINTPDGIVSVNTKNGNTVSHPIKINGKAIEIWTINEIDNKIWIGNNSHGLIIYDPQSRTFEQYKNNPNDSNSLRQNFIGPIKYHKAKYYIGTTDGTQIFNPISKKFTNFNSTIYLRNTKRVLVPWSYFFDKDEKLWLSSEFGLYTYDEKENKMKYEFMDETETVIKNIIQDEYDNMWFATAHKIYMLNAKTRLINNVSDNFDIETKFGEHLIKTNNGKIWIGSDDGVLEVNTKIAQLKSKKWSVFINNFFINNIKIHPSDTSSILKKDFVLYPNITLNYDQNNFQFDFVMLNYDKASENRYAYKIENYDKDWIMSDNRNTAYYTNMPPGKYIIRIKGSNYLGEWSEYEAAYNLEIIPAWWQTIWFKLILLGLFFLSVYIYFRYRTWTLVKRNELLKIKIKERTKEIEVQQEEIIAINEELKSTNDYLTRMNQEKSDLISIVSHDMKAPLNRAIGLTDILYSEAETFKDHQKMILEKLKKELSDEKALITDILTIEEATEQIRQTKTTEIQLDKFISEIIIGFMTVADAKNIKLKLEVKSENVLINVEKTALKRILDNLISNAIKFSPENKQVIVVIEKLGPHAYCRIIDNGPGFSVQDKLNLFKKYAKLSAKPTAGESSTGLGLSIVKTLVEAMNGKIELQDNPEGGAIFILIFQAN